MKKISMILIVAAFAVTSISADKAAKAAMKECIKGAEKSYTEAMKACKEQKGKERRECIKGAATSRTEAKKSCRNAPAPSSAPAASTAPEAAPSTAPAEAK